MHYFDHNATTPVATEVLEAMLPFLRERWGNPSSVYAFGNELGKAIETARASVASLIGALPEEIIFTSCGSESCNTAIRSALKARAPRRHLVMSSVEHSACLKCAADLEKEGVQVSYVPVNEQGQIEIDAIESAIQNDTAMVSVMWANNETGVIFPIDKIADLCSSKRLLFHSDAIAAIGKVPVNVRECPIDYLSLSGHKLYAPKGIGALFVRKGIAFHPLIFGGGQESGRRAGTQNVASMIALGRAAELSIQHLQSESIRLNHLRNHLENELVKRCGARIHGAFSPRLSNTSNLTFSGLEAEALLLLLEREGICASSGSACSTGALEPSHVLTAMGVSRADAFASLRFSLGRWTQSESIDHLLSVMPHVVGRLRGALPHAI